MPVMLLKKFDEVQQVGAVERAMNEWKKFFKIRWAVIQYEIMGSIFHQVHQFHGLVDNGGTIAPCENSSKKSGDFDVLFFSKAMWNTDRIFLNEKRPIVFGDFFIQQYVKRFDYFLRFDVGGWGAL